MIKGCSVIGVFPPPYGGVTIKCKLFCSLLQKHAIPTTQVDVYEISRKKQAIGPILLQCIKAFCSDKPIVYCMDSKRLRAIMLLQRLFRKSFSQTTVLAVGGVFQQTLTEHKSFEQTLKKIRGIWVETESMKTQLEQMGFQNIEFFPNPKSEAGCCEPKPTDPHEPLRLVFFSQISREKGVEDIIELVRLLEDTSVDYVLDFYGHVVSDFKEKFEQFVQAFPKVRYCGVFDATRASVYQELNGYDILLFPTHWFTEGVPGILVEAKMAGLAVIASDRSYNSEMVQVDKNEGFLVKENYVQEMLEIIRCCAVDRMLLYKMKQGSYWSRKRYALEEYEDMIGKL